MSKENEQHMLVPEKNERERVEEKRAEAERDLIPMMNAQLPKTHKASVVIIGKVLRFITTRQK